MSAWTHSICIDCWTEKNPNREPVRLAHVVTKKDTCCYCGKEHDSGIFVRGNPQDTKFCTHKDD